MAKVVRFENGKYGVRKWSLWPIYHDFLDNGGKGDILEFHWWHDIGGHSPSVRESCEFSSKDAAQAKLNRWLQYKNTPSSAINDSGKPA